jgi:hypothetical protein
MRRVSRRSWAACGAALTVALVVAGCARAPLPRHLGGLSRSRFWSGDAARHLMEELHGRQATQGSAAVAEYGRAGQLRVYRSRFADVATAHGTFMRMLGRLGSGETPFSPPRELRELPGRWFTVGPGGHHALWESGDSIYWLTGDPDLLERAVDELPAPSTGIWT